MKTIEERIQEAKDRAKARKGNAPCSCGTTDLILFNSQAPGDILAITGAVYSLHHKYPGKYRTKVEGVYAPELYRHNPNFTDLRQGRRIEMHCPDINLSHFPNVHFLSTWCSHLGKVLGIDLPLATTTPKLYLSDEERALPKLKNHWVICSGYKDDVECKSWGYSRYQAVVDALPELTFVQIGESWHNHKALQGRNVVNKVGAWNGTCRPLIQLVSQCDGTLSGVTFLQHIAAALNKPAVVVNFREPDHFTTYPRQRTLSVNGCLPCNQSACWKGALKPDGHGNRCELPLWNETEQTWESKCSTMITPPQVVKAIKDFQYNA